MMSQAARETAFGLTIAVSGMTFLPFPSSGGQRHGLSTWWLHRSQSSVGA